MSETVAFEDNFSAHAAVYARHRPRYPDTLFAYLASLAPARELAWDCGTGNGQAAVGLAEYFEQVIATDASAEQIAHATPRERIAYRVTTAEEAGEQISPQSVDIVTVAQALHWFDLDTFYAVVQRVLKPDGVLAAWCYHLPVIPEVDPVVTFFYNEVVGPYWSPRVRLADEHYQTIPFPFDEKTVPPAPPSLAATAKWKLNDLIGYLDSWSATRRFLTERDYHPIDEIRSDLEAAWGDPTTQRSVRLPLYLRAGTVPAETT